MPVKLVAKTKAQKKVKEVETTAPYAQIVEQMANLKAEIDMAKVAQKSYDEHRKYLLDKIPEDIPAGLPYEFMGISHKAVFNKQATNRIFKPGAMKKLHEMLGDDIFYSLCNVTLASVDKYVSQVEQEELFDTDYSGVRTCSIKSVE